MDSLARAAIASVLIPSILRFGTAACGACGEGPDARALDAARWQDTRRALQSLLARLASDIGDLTAHFGDSQRTRRRIILEGSGDVVRRSDAVMYAIDIGTRSGVPVRAGYVAAAGV